MLCKAPAFFELNHYLLILFPGLWGRPATNCSIFEALVFFKCFAFFESPARNVLPMIRLLLVKFDLFDDTNTTKLNCNYFIIIVFCF